MMTVSAIVMIVATLGLPSAAGAHSAVVDVCGAVDDGSDTFALLVKAVDEYTEIEKIEDAAVREAETARLLKVLCEVADRATISFPNRASGQAPALKLGKVRRVLASLQTHADAAMKGKDDARSAELIAARMGIARLVMSGGAIAHVVGCQEFARGVEWVMPHIVGGRMGAAARTRIAEAASRDLSSRDGALEKHRASFEHEVRVLWSRLPAGLFGAAAEGGETWSRIDEELRRDVALMLSIGNERPPGFPLPTEREMIAECSLAAERVRAWRAMPPLRARESAETDERSAQTARERRLASWSLTLLAQDLELVRAELARAGVRTAIALEEFREQRGEYPRSLDELMPRFLQAVADDPVMPGVKLGYFKGPREIGGTRYGYVLYSRGVDGEDNQGSAGRTRQIDMRSHRAGEDIVLNALE